MMTFDGENDDMGTPAAPAEGMPKAPAEETPAAPMGDDDASTEEGAM